MVKTFRINPEKNNKGVFLQYPVENLEYRGTAF
jgi:hypothetical protein